MSNRSSTGRSKLTAKAKLIIETNNRPLGGLDSEFGLTVDKKSEREEKCQWRVHPGQLKRVEWMMMGN